jgi:hypothetical protein
MIAAASMRKSSNNSYHKKLMASWPLPAAVSIKLSEKSKKKAVAGPHVCESGGEKGIAA